MRDLRQNVRLLEIVRMSHILKLQQQQGFLTEHMRRNHGLLASEVVNMIIRASKAEHDWVHPLDKASRYGSRQKLNTR